MIVSSTEGLFSDTVVCVDREGQRCIRVMDAEVRPMGDYDVEIQTLFSYISAGTELSALNSQTGGNATLSKPIRLGYSISGVVLRVGSEVKHVRAGERVAAIGAGAFHSRRVVVSSRLVCRVPDSVTSEIASMMAMFCFSLEGVYKGETRIGDNVLVLGAGIMGQITARLFHADGCRVALLDKNAFRIGFLPPSIPGWLLDSDGWKAVREWTNGYGLDVASICFGGDATNTVESLKTLMRCSPDGIQHGRIVFPGGARLNVLMASNMGNIELVSSAKAGPGYRDPAYEQGGHYPSGYVRSTVTRNLETLMGMVEDGRLGDVGKLITHRYPFEQAAEAYRLLQQPDAQVLGVLLAYDSLL